jgi:hypothetical protein
VVAATQQQEEAVRKAQSQQLERLRYQAHILTGSTANQSCFIP